MLPNATISAGMIYSLMPAWRPGLSSWKRKSARTSRYGRNKQVGVGAIPGAGDAVDLYELIAGRDLFTGEKLNSHERCITALGLLVGSGSSWRQLAHGLDAELAAVSSRVAARNIAEARQSLKEAVTCFE